MLKNLPILRHECEQLVANEARSFPWLSLELYGQKTNVLNIKMKQKMRSPLKGALE